MFSSRIAVQSYDEVTNRRICLLRIVVWPGDGVRDHGLVVVNFFLHGGLWDGRQLSSVDDFPDGRGEDAACVLGRRLRLRRFVGLVGRQLFFWRGFPHTTKRERSQFVISFQRRRLDHYEVRSEIKELRIRNKEIWQRKKNVVKTKNSKRKEKRWWSPITLRELMSHRTSFVPKRWPGPWESAKKKCVVWKSCCFERDYWSIFLYLTKRHLRPAVADFDRMLFPTLHELSVALLFQCDRRT